MHAGPSPTLAVRCLAFALVGVVSSGCSKPSPLVTAPAMPPTSVVFANARVFDVVGGVTAPDQDVVVTGETITAMGPTGTVTIPDGAERIDARGATLLPGLIDSHGHVANGSAPPWAREFPDPDRNLQAYLYCGVTTVLDPADLEPDAFDRRDAVNARTLLGPTIFASGPMLTAVGGHPLPVIEELAPWWIRWYVVRHAVRPLATDADVQTAIDGLAAARADFVKIAIDSIPEGAPRMVDALAASVVTKAHEKGLRVVAHIGTFADAIEAGSAGVDAFVHMVYKEPLDAAGAARIAAFGKPVVATMGVFESYALSGDKRVSTPLERETVDAELLASFDKAPEGAISPAFREFFDLLKATRLAWRTSIRLMRAEGVTILAGSDAQSGVFPGAGLHREFALLVESGMTPAEVIRSATWDAARFLEKSADPSFGAVAVGKRADLVLVDGDPGADVANLAKIRVVMKRGVPLRRHPVGGA
ncbi:MAG: amidohydrolase family protein [Candidatus Binatia bacterium]